MLKTGTIIPALPMRFYLVVERLITVRHDCGGNIILQEGSSCDRVLTLPLSVPSTQWRRWPNTSPGCYYPGTGSDWSSSSMNNVSGYNSYHQKHCVYIASLLCFFWPWVWWWNGWTNPPLSLRCHLSTRINFNMTFWRRSGRLIRCWGSVQYPILSYPSVSFFWVFICIP